MADIAAEETEGTGGKAVSRRDFLTGAAAFAAVPPRPRQDAPSPADDPQGEEIAAWDMDAAEVTPETYRQYLRDGDTRGLAALEKLEAAFEKVAGEARETVVDGGVPAVWSVYNMGYVVKTRQALFSIDLVHRRDAELAPLLDFALVTHNHGDHWRQGFYRAMDGAGKTVISNFLDNYGAADWRKGGSDWHRAGGYARGAKTFKIKDVEIRTSLIDHNEYLTDFTTAFEIRTSGGFSIYHTGDSGRGTVPKLKTHAKRPDLWLFFPGCGIDVPAAVAKVRAKKIVFGHMWELGHAQGRFKEPAILRRLSEARAARCKDVSLAFWGERIV